MFALSTSGVLAQPKLVSSSKRCSAKRAVRAMPMAKMVRLFIVYMNFRFFFLFLSVSAKKMVGIHRRKRIRKKECAGRISRGF
jgi:hypothetical protein